MTIIGVWKCETCGTYFDNQADANTHLASNTKHIIVECYVEEGFNVKPQAIVITSPDDSLWKITIDNDGVLSTTKL